MRTAGEAMQKGFASLCGALPESMECWQLRGKCSAALKQFEDQHSGILVPRMAAKALMLHRSQKK
eukprot:CAMPEP_0194759726 /NCGR_PEP_ID=MMETSP0323_2-20130528/12747_1 /TAXON_ID=2866 ORGANISM="Crypthecodinium cohnii, Strain Seligo" /NCGR_SAMPLE_ID=MMETSP0323_2 /ASSEMBLY_ACC=CAM_ASM_000346 /LENGTH=64 /DNA_ID=CAMNT_0039680625 /DNA_START=363 /DNA_END=554 /DNA_ORIENTATION=-